MPSLTVGVYAHWRKPGAADFLEALLKALRQEKINVHTEEHAARLIGIPGLPLEELARRVDLLVALGGDGTLLRLVRDLRGQLRPIMGINFGSLGFLTCFSGTDFASVARSLMQGDYRVDERTLLSAAIERDGEVLHEQSGLNDVVVSRGERARLVRIEVHLDGSPLTQYNADGLIVATSTGSTAYSLSAGGPIITPNAGVFVITPICAHVLTNRSVIVANRSVITLTTWSGDLPLLLSVDGQEAMHVRPKEVVIIRAAGTRLPLLLPKNLSFADILRSKLRWSGTAI